MDKLSTQYTPVDLVDWLVVRQTCAKDLQSFTQTINCPINVWSTPCTAPSPLPCLSTMSTVHLRHVILVFTSQILCIHVFLPLLSTCVSSEFTSTTLSLDRGISIYF